ncbi:MAG: GDP-mannose mannosyl hydrolase, partial [Saccharospirillaceae bacterium]|nr:GDP-mannose mannosyl hydrolase [Pseudomonadales bacterium]NRB81835.1 GDP-mannose mannosyl hydrolase [Saccharospirillaceae bacterium]
MLEKTLFQSIVKHTPLVSIDLIVRNSKGQILLGKRNNKPA